MPDQKIAVNSVQLRAYLDAQEAFLGKKITVGFISGVFDLLHPGHRYFLSESKKHCDFLTVNVACDKVAKRKGVSRPLMDQFARVSAIAALDCVDAVLAGTSAKDEQNRMVTAPEVYLPLRADIAFFGSDYTMSTLLPHHRHFAPQIKLIAGDMGCHTSQILASLTRARTMLRLQPLQPNT